MLLESIRRIEYVLPPSVFKKLRVPSGLDSSNHATAVGGEIRTRFKYILALDSRQPHRALASPFVVYHSSRSSSSTSYTDTRSFPILILPCHSVLFTHDVFLAAAMSTADSLTYRVATAADSESLATLANSSFRGELALQGWTHENELLEGPRSNPNALCKMMETTGSVILVFFGKTDAILKGCVHLEHKPETKAAYLGMLTVRPDLQRNGYGRFILAVAEDFSKSEWNVDYIEMRVVLERPELIAYYKRRGYTDTGIREPFPKFEFVRPKRDNLQFCILRKSLTQSSD